MAGLRGHRPDDEPVSLSLNRRLDQIDRALGAIARKLDRLNERQFGVEARCSEMLIALERAEESHMAQSEAVTHLVQEVTETKGKVASVLALVRGIPELIRKAVEDALAANPSLSPEDLAAITQAADDLDAAQGEIEAAINAGGAGDGEPEEPPVEPAPVE